ncbi:MAG: hypothetical protein AAGI07_01665 [Bacteroidota bacterium]
METKSKSILCFLLFFHFGSLAQVTNIDYFTLEKPTTIPENFNPSILGFKESFIFNATYSLPSYKEFYFTKAESRENIYYAKKVNDVWTAPTIASFSSPHHQDADPFFTTEGNRVYFVSSRPTHVTDSTNDFNIWYADRNGESWHEPIALPAPINTDYQEYFFSISDKGNAFFSSNRSGGLGSFDIYQTKILEDGSMSKPTNVGKPISSEYYEYDPFVASDESFMVYTIIDKPGGEGKSDIYFSIKGENGEWTNPINLGDKVNTAEEDFAASISPDNQYLFYTNNGELHWVSIELLDALKAGNE